MAIGTVVHYDESQGRGRIAPDSGAVQLPFVHKDIALEGFKSLEAGDRVAFESVLRSSSLAAVDIRPLSAVTA